VVCFVTTWGGPPSSKSRFGILAQWGKLWTSLGSSSVSSVCHPRHLGNPVWPVKRQVSLGQRRLETSQRWKEKDHNESLSLNQTARLLVFHPVPYLSTMHFDFRQFFNCILFLENKFEWEYDNQLSILWFPKQYFLAMNGSSSSTLSVSPGSSSPSHPGLLNGNNKINPFLLGVAGGTASGKVNIHCHLWVSSINNGLYHFFIVYSVRANCSGRIFTPRGWAPEADCGHLPRLILQRTEWGWAENGKERSF